MNLRNAGWDVSSEDAGAGLETLCLHWLEFSLELGRDVRLLTFLLSCSPHSPLIIALPQSREMVLEDKRPIASGDAECSVFP